MRRISRILFAIKPFTFGLLVGLAIVVTANSLGHVVLIQVVPDSLTILQESVR